MLNRLERASKRQQDPSARTAYAEEDGITDLFNDIDEVTRKLSTALETLESLYGSLGVPYNDATQSDRSSTQTPMSPSSMTTNSDDGIAQSTASSAWSFSSNRASFAQRTSAYSQSAQNHDCKPEEEKQVASSRKMADPISPPAASTRVSPSLKSDRWSNQFAYFDPMSVDIDSASSLILGRRPSPYPPALMARSPARMGSPSPGCAPASSDVETRSPLQTPTRDVDSYIARSASLRSASLPVRSSGNDGLYSSASLRRSPGGLF